MTKSLDDFYDAALARQQELIAAGYPEVPIGVLQCSLLLEEEGAPDRKAGGASMM